ncbi:hypothetical protein AX17_002065 [Amanita inopinata Kibby_2008]|nr:hypothetical protein AX17_002065 [Amanita inopinata Kibby_2008]
MSQYIDRKSAADSYRPKAGTMSPGLLRAREPYRFRNALTGLGLGICAVAIWAYSISAVKQDVFDDIDEEARALSGGRSTPASASRDQVTVGSATPMSSSLPADSISAARSQADESLIATAAEGSEARKRSGDVERTFTNAASPQRQGVLQHLDSRFPHLLDPKTKTWVWGAPPVDSVGIISESKS